MRYPGGGFSTTSSNGLRAEDNAYFVEGLFNSEPYSGQAIINGAGIAGDSATILPIDSIQEFNVQQNPPAEYGWKPGSVVNVGLKSGTNRLHGTAFAFGATATHSTRRNYFNQIPNQQTNPGPGAVRRKRWRRDLIQDKLFFFGAYEGQMYNVGNSFGGITSPRWCRCPPMATAFLRATGDCADSIPDAIAELQAAGGPSQSRKSQHCRLRFVRHHGNLQRQRISPQQQSQHRIANGFNNNVQRRRTSWRSWTRVNDRQNINGMYFFGNNSGNGRRLSRIAGQMAVPLFTRGHRWRGEAGSGPPNRELGERGPLWL